MKFEDFTEALSNHGWEAVHDAQFTEIEKLWRKLFPVVAELQDEVIDLEKDIREYSDAQPPI